MPSESRTQPNRPPGTNSARASTSTARSDTLSTTAASTYQGAADPIDAHATPAMKNAPQPSSTSARAAARHTEPYDTSVLEASTTRIRSDGEKRGVSGTIALPRYTSRR